MLRKKKLISLHYGGGLMHKHYYVWKLSVNSKRLLISLSREFDLF